MRARSQPLLSGLRHTLAVGALLSLVGATPVPTVLMVGLVIGNQAYPGASLSNPVNDARAMGEILRSDGFRVVELHDATRTQMEQAIGEFRDALKGQNGVAMLYYAGHGLQLDWHNFMVPVDAKIGHAADLPNQAIDMQDIIDALKASGTRMNIVVLDACRDNPFLEARSGKGLAQIDAPPGTFLAYSTAPGNLAEDGEPNAVNSLYTGILVKEMTRPDAKIEDVFKRVRFQVRRQTQGRQIPWESTSLDEDFSFASGPPVAAISEEHIRTSEFDTQNAAWERIKDSNDATAFYAFLDKYPNGFISEQAQFRLERLAKAQIEVAPRRDGVKTLASGLARYRVGDHLQYDVSDPYGKPLEKEDDTVTALSPGSIVVNGGDQIWDEMGNLVKDVNGTRNPAKVYYPADLSSGKKWHSAYEVRTKNNKLSIYWDFRVVALEPIEVPAGRFEAYRVEGQGWVSDGRYQTQTYWIDPKTFVTVKDIWLRRMGAKIDAGWRRELRKLELVAR